MDPTLRALNRFGLGARIGERRRITDPRGWLRAQLDGGPPELGTPPAASSDDIADALRAVRAGRDGNEQERQEAGRRLVDLTLAESRSALAWRVATDRPFIERLVAFWSNHLCVSAAARLQVAALAGSYEREAIRPYVLGRFEDMVLASARHPAMLFYLDNFQSIGPTSQGARLARSGRGGGRGLNENYARELLELHTLGVDGGYTQQDVQELAKILTGWTVDGLAAGPAMRLPQPDAGMRARRRPGGRGQPRPTPPAADGPIQFVFRDPLHEPGTKTLLGVAYREAGVAEGERAIRALCRHSSTARFVATKLVTHFVADEPPPGAIERVADAFRENDGDLRVVSHTLIDLPEAWRDDLRKFRTPQDWVIAALRAFDADEVADAVPALLRQLRHPLWSPDAPKGFGDTMPEWADPDSLLNRAELARPFARRLSSRELDSRRVLDVVDVPSGDALYDLVSDNSIPADERVALALAGPAFQWR